MSLKYRSSNGTETPIAGLNGTSGELVPSVSVIRTGQINLPTTEAGAWNTFEVTFDTPMPDADYQVIMDNTNVAYVHVQAVINKGANGFGGILYTRDVISSRNQSVVKYTAFKLMTDEVTALDEARIEQNTKNFAPNFSATSSYAVGDYCTYQGVLYRCTVAHTASAWNSSHFTATNVGSEIHNKITINGVNGNFYVKDYASTEAYSNINNLNTVYNNMPNGSRYTAYVASITTLNGNPLPGSRDGIITIVKCTGAYGDYAEWHNNDGDIWYNHVDNSTWQTWKQVSLS